MSGKETREEMKEKERTPKNEGEYNEGFLRSPKVCTNNIPIEECYIFLCGPSIGECWAQHCDTGDNVTPA